MARIVLDTSRWPIVVVTPPNEVSNDDLNAFFVDYERAVTRGERYVIVLDLRRCADLPAAQRRVITDRMQKNEQRSKLYCAGTVLIFQSALMRGLLTAILWVRKPPQEIAIAATLEEAFERAEAWLKALRVA